MTHAVKKRGTVHGKSPEANIKNLQKSAQARDPLDVAMTTIGKLALVAVGSEDDLIAKVVIPFFMILGFTEDSYELKYPVEGYRTRRRGRKPEADCVLFGGLPHGPDTSLLVAEIKRPLKMLPRVRPDSMRLIFSCPITLPGQIDLLKSGNYPTFVSRP